MTPFHLPRKGLAVVSGPRPGCSTTEEVVAPGTMARKTVGTNEAWPASVQYEVGPTKRADG